ncbi:MBL fold metallo-hydrolase RNA specificity domain-containing protein [Prosthecochloris sp. HL-130-GSB]|uniref:MBL fold metallo-hydrolase RNA specificity domain-containing protein n=1 Tax=Prosthecochloris sp. HL-130-GSB TaxID=1974213 RepID=UPI00351509F2
MSAHGDQHDLLRWAGGFRGSPRFYVVHGEGGPKNVLMHMLDRQYGYPASVPRRGDVIDVTGSSSRVE